MKQSFIFAIALLISKTCFCQQSLTDLKEHKISDTTFLTINTTPEKFGSGDFHKKISTGIITGNIHTGSNKVLGRIGTEITYSFSEKISLVGNYLVKLSNEPFEEKDYAGGIRFYSGTNQFKFFVETLIDLNVRVEMININSSLQNSTFGVVLGAGTELKLLNNFSGILKTSLYKFNKPGTSVGMFAGLKYRF